MNLSTNNLVILRGNLGQDPDIKSGGCVELRLCTTQGRGDKEVREWHTIKAFGQLGDLCAKFLKKGRGVGIVGRLTYFETEPEKTVDGSKRKYAEIVADQVDFL